MVTGSLQVCHCLLMLQLRCEVLGAVQIGHDLLTAAGRADEATSAVKLTERKNWLNIAAKMFRSTSEGKHIAARYHCFFLVSLHTRDQHV